MERDKIKTVLFLCKKESISSCTLWPSRHILGLNSHNINNNSLGHNLLFTEGLKQGTAKDDGL